MSEGYMWFEGIPFPVVGYAAEHLRAMQNFVFKDEDVLTLSFPKSGGSHVDPICAHLGTFSWVETTHGHKALKDKEGPRLITSHLPIQLFPKSVFQSKTKVIYLIRNPRDVLVSGYFFWIISNFVKKPESLEEYFEWFLQGNVAFGSWFDHARGWMSMRGKENFLVVSYEQLKQDTRSAVQNICRYLGKTLDPEEMNLVLKNSSFQVMKENKMSNYTLLPSWLLDGKRGSLMRKGTAGDWKNHFTVTQAEVFDKIFQEKMAGLPPELFPWE